LLKGEMFIRAAAAYL